MNLPSWSQTAVRHAEWGRKRATTGSWLALAGDPGFVSCTALKRTYVQQMSLLKRVILKAHEVVGVMVAGRFDPAGEKSLRTVQLDPTDLSLSYRYTRASRGRGVAAQPCAE